MARQKARSCVDCDGPGPYEYCGDRYCAYCLQTMRGAYVVSCGDDWVAHLSDAQARRHLLADVVDSMIQADREEVRVLARELAEQAPARCSPDRFDLSKLADDLCWLLAGGRSARMALSEIDSFIEQALACSSELVVLTEQGKVLYDRRLEESFRVAPTGPRFRPSLLAVAAS